jgi:hypothetical protein
MKRFHLIAGVVLFIAFLLTGQYMDRVHAHLEFMPDGPRMIYRSRHIYILFSSMINLGLGSYFQYRSRPVQRALQLIGSLLITVAAGLLIGGFFYEPGLTGLNVPVSRMGIYITGVGILLHAFSAIGTNSTES